MLKGQYIISSRRLGQEEQREASSKVVKYSDDLMHPDPARRLRMLGDSFSTFLASSIPWGMSH